MTYWAVVSPNGRYHAIGGTESQAIAKAFDQVTWQYFAASGWRCIPVTILPAHLPLDDHGAQDAADCREDGTVDRGHV